jgi:hypothetical protein
MNDETLRLIGRACLYQAIQDYWSLIAAESLRDSLSESRNAPITNVNRQKFEYYQAIINETHDAVDWFISDDVYPFSFCQICTMLGLDHDYIRARLDTYTRIRPRFVRPEQYSGVLDSQHASSKPMEHQHNNGPVCDAVQADLWDGAQ